MDSISQMVLGASVAALAAPAGHRRHALALGAVLGTLPDLDVLIRHADPITAFTCHRGFSHSVLVLPWVALALWAAMLWWWRDARAQRWRWLLAFELALVTHPLLDAFTVYGTQLWWPMQSPPVMIGSIFIIDPLYTIGLLTGVIIAWRLNAKPRATFWLGTGLAISCAYLAWGLLAQQHIAHAIRVDQDQRGAYASKILVTPAPFNSLLWRVLVMRDNGDYLEGWYSFLAGSDKIQLNPYPGNRLLLESLADQQSLQRLDWFTHGFLGAELDGDRVLVKDLRMGQEGAYGFRFAIGERRDGATIPITPQQLPWGSPADRERLAGMWDRLRGHR